jgi:hypothetical protein
MNDSMQRIISLSFKVGVLPFEEARQILLENASLFDEGIEDAIAKGQHPAEIIAMLDTVKSLLFRTQLVRRHMSMAGHGDGASVLFIPSSQWWDGLLTKYQNITVCYLYLSRNGSLWAFIASVGAALPIKYAKFEVIPRSEDVRFHAKLIQYIHGTATHNYDFDLLEELIALSSKLVMFLGAAPGHDRLFICPHSLLNIIPWHAISIRRGNEVLFIDDFFRSISYISSIQDLLSSGLNQPVDSQKPLRMLAVLDSKAQLAGVEREQKFFEILRDAGIPIDIVVDKALKAEDVAGYQLVNWSSHAKSDPCSWGGSFLSLASKRYSASEISQNWSLALGAFVILAACETSIELGALERLDEYCGLDYGFRIAGARSVCGTMWPVQDTVAEKANLLLWSAIWGLLASPSQAVVIMQRMLRTRKWQDLTGYQFNISSFTWKALQDSFEDGLESFIPAYFSDIQCWAVFRCFGL